MCFDLMPDAVRDPVGFDRRLGQAVGEVVELDVRLIKEEAIAPDCLPALAFLGVGRHPHDGVSGDLLGGVVDETIYPGQGLFVRTRCCSARQEGVDAGLAIGEENAAGLGTHRCLDERPRFGGGDPDAAAMTSPPSLMTTKAHPFRASSWVGPSSLDPSV